MTNQINTARKKKINYFKSLADVEADYMTAEEYRRMLEDDAREEGIKEDAQRLLGATADDIKEAQSLLATDSE